MEAATVILVLLLLACPLAMLFLHRHGGAGHGAEGARQAPSLADLRRRRRELDDQILACEEREARAREGPA